MRNNAILELSSTLDWAESPVDSHLRQGREVKDELKSIGSKWNTVGGEQTVISRRLTTPRKLPLGHCHSLCSVELLADTLMSWKHENSLFGIIFQRCQLSCSLWPVLTVSPSYSNYVLAGVIGIHTATPTDSDGSK